MKKSTFKSALITFSLLCAANAVLAQDCFTFHLNEESVQKFGRYGKKRVRTYDTTDLQENLAFFYDNFKYADDAKSDPVTLDSCIEKVSLANICTFYNDIITTGKYNPPTDFAALRVHYGMQGKKLLMIFEPIILKRNDKRTRRRHNYDQATTSNKLYLLNDTGGLTLLALKDYDLLVDSYQKPTSHIYIDHHVITDDHKCDTGDVSSTVLLLQYIIEMYLDNTKVPKSTDEITFSFVATHFRHGPYLMQHIVAYHNIGVKVPKEDDEIDYGYRSFGVDFSQMCPPQCGLIKIKSKIR